MKAVTFQDVESLSVETVPDPEIADPGDILVRMRRAGICGSDLHVYYGRERGLDTGTVMGHELLGEIVEAGREVRGLSRGDLVVVPFSTSCGRCHFCESGLTSRCARGQLFGWVEQGRGLQGAQSEIVRVPLASSSAVKVPSDLDPDIGLFLGDILSTGYYCAEMGGVRPGSSCAVVGCGPVGLMAIISARSLGAEVIHALDFEEERLEKARRFGASPLRAGQEAVEAVRASTRGLGVDAVLEAVGSPSSQKLAYDLVRPGGTIAVVGVHTAANFSFTPAQAYDKNITYKVGRCPARHYMQKLIPLARESSAEIGSIISHRLPIAEAPDAYRMFGERKPGWSKVVLIA